MIPSDLQKGGSFEGLDQHIHTRPGRREKAGSFRAIRNEGRKRMGLVNEMDFMAERGSTTTTKTTDPLFLFLFFFVNVFFFDSIAIEVSVLRRGFPPAYFFFVQTDTFGWDIIANRIVAKKFGTMLDWRSVLISFFFFWILGSIF